MRKIIGIGETVFDIIFKEEQPISGRPGGSVYNALITLGRLGVRPMFISEIGNDRISEIIKRVLENNNVDTSCIYAYSGRSPLALAFLDENQNADYSFYKDYPDARLDYIMPRIDEDDIVLISSYFALNPVLREKLIEILEFAHDRKAIIYYDLNFRKSHIAEVRHLMPSIIENYEYADIIKGSEEDFRNIYNESDAKQTYKDHIEFYTKNFIYTQGAKGAQFFAEGYEKCHKGKEINAVSTVGAGDNFNAGIVYGLIKENVRWADLHGGNISPQTWDKIISYAIEFSAYVCTTLDNYISPELASKYKI